MTPPRPTIPEPPPAGNARRGVTLLEILGVMLIFFIIWAFVFPAAEGLVRNSRRRQASADVHAIASALLEYRRVYGSFPGTGLPDASDSGDLVYCPAAASGGAPAVTVDAGVRTADAEVLLQALLPAGELNPRGIAFLEPDHARIRDGVLIDPWDDPYIAVVDADANGWVGAQSGNEISSFHVRTAAGRNHEVPPLRDLVYVFSWTQAGSESNRVATVGGK